LASPRCSWRSGASASFVGGLIRGLVGRTLDSGRHRHHRDGLHFLGLTRIGLLMREGRLTAPKRCGLWGAYVMGLAFAFGWTPCIGRSSRRSCRSRPPRRPSPRAPACLASIRSGSAFRSCCGVHDRAILLAVRAMKRHLDTVERAMGVLMVITGIGFLTGAVSGISIWLLETFPHCKIG